jgi:hypothetical protein
MGLLATVGVGAICSVVIGSWLTHSKRSKLSVGLTQANPSLPRFILQRQTMLRTRRLLSVNLLAIPLYLQPSCRA